METIAERTKLYTHEHNERYRPTVDVLYQRLEVMRHFGIPPVAFEKIGKEYANAVWHENAHLDLSPVGSFKERGALLAMLHEVEQGNMHFVTASAGNHAQGMAHAARLLGAHVTVYMPESTPDIKIEGVEALGDGHVTARFAADFELAQKLAQNHSGAVYVSPYDNYHVIAGQGTAAFETLLARPDTDVLYVTIGGGGLLAGTLENVGTLKDAGLVKPTLKVVGVTVEGNDSMQRTIESGHLMPATELNPICEGGAVLRPGGMPAEMILEHARQRKDVRFMTVSEAQLAEMTQRHQKRHEAQLRAGYGVFPIAETTGALPEVGARLDAQRYPLNLGANSINSVALVTGRNADSAKLQYLQETYPALDAPRHTYERKIGGRACSVSGGPVGHR